MNYYVYILFSQSSDSYYISSAKDLRESLRLHNSGLVEKTEDNKPWKLIWYGAFLSDNEAEAFSEYLKSAEGTLFYKKWFIKSPSEPAPQKVHRNTLETNRKKSKPLRPSNAKICPICAGSGEAANDVSFYRGSRYLKNVTTCLTCVGKGWIDSDKKAPLLE